MKRKSLSRREFLKVAGATGVGLTTITISGAFGSKARGQEKVGQITLRQDWLHTGYHAPMWVAQDKGWYKENGLKVQIERGFGSGDTAKRVGIGQDPVGQCDAGAVILTIGEGMKQKVVGTFFPVAPYCIVSGREKGIKAPKDLEGKTLAANAYDPTYIFWPYFVKRTGINGKAVNINTVSGEVLNAQLLAGKVDGVMTYATGGVSLAVANNVDLNVIMYKDYGFDVYSNSFTAYAPWLESNEDLVRRFLDATYKGVKYTMLNPKEALAAVKKYQPESFIGENEERYRYEVLRTWAALNITDVNKNFGLGYISEEKMRATNDMTYEYKGMKQKVPLDTIYTNKYLPGLKLSSAEWQKVNELYQDYRRLLNL